MELHIVSPVGKKTIKITWLEVDTPVGNFVIQEGHAPTVLTLQPERDVIYRLKNGQQKTLMIKSGLVKITRDSALLLLDE